MNPKMEIARRVRDIREQLYGRDNIDQLALALRVPAATLRNYEAGVTMPAEVVLQFLVVCRVNPDWLLCGNGDPFLPCPDQSQIGYAKAKPTESGGFPAYAHRLWPTEHGQSC